MLESNGSLDFPTSLDEMDDALSSAHELPFSSVLIFDENRARIFKQNLLIEASTVQWLITWGKFRVSSNITTFFQANFMLAHCAIHCHEVYPEMSPDFRHEVCTLETS